MNELDLYFNKGALNIYHQFVVGLLKVPDLFSTYHRSAACSDGGQRRDVTDSRGVVGVSTAVENCRSDVHPVRAIIMNECTPAHQNNHLSKVHNLKQNHCLAQQDTNRLNENK